jgi:hypothetical protein
MMNLTQNRVAASKILALAVLLGTLMAAMLLATVPSYAAGTTFIVNSNGDAADASSFDGLCQTATGTCTLRAAIEQSNATVGVDTIRFGITTDGSPAIIAPNSALPPLTDTVTIDGYTQPGASPNTLTRGTNAVLKVELDGINAGFSDGLKLAGSGAGSVIKGLVINNFNGDGISVEEGSDFDRIEGNFIGTDPTGTVAKKIPGDGVIIIHASNTTVGGNLPAARNLISGNGDSGVLLLGSSGSKVLGNLVGTRKGGNGALGNGSEGIGLFDSSGTSISANTIAFKDLHGVRINASSGPNPNIANGNLIVGNSIFSNGLLGTDLGGGTENAQDATANDPGDADVGPNGLQNKPVITSARTVSGKTTVKGSLNSAPNKTFNIQLFSNPSGNEGKTFIGQTAVRTDASGNATFTFTPTTAVAVGRTITATATDSLASNTSEFSAPRGVIAG